MGRISKTLERLSSEHQESSELKSDAAKAGCKLIASQPDRAVVILHGVLRSVTLRPVDGITALEAELYDGSASVTLVWLGRRRIEGIVAGRQRAPAVIARAAKNAVRRAPGLDVCRVPLRIEFENKTGAFPASIPAGRWSSPDA